jgi:hypothetical protein
MVDKSCEKLLYNFECVICEYSTGKKSSYDKHLTTLKHVNTINTIKYNNNSNFIKEKEKEKEYTCNCGKKYQYNASLFNHKKKCKESEKFINKDEMISAANISGANISGANISEATISEANISEANISEANISEESISDGSSNIIQLLIKENSDFKNIILEMVKSNSDLQKQMIDVCQYIQPGTINANNNNTNSHNKTFNLQFFLNEECKDAMNMSEFINSIEVKLSDLENISKHGYVEGMSNIIIKKLNDTDIYKRPVHCSDAKRETLYVKEENKWEKNTQENRKMIKAVRGVDKKNYMMLNTWREVYPKSLDGQTRQCDEYMKLLSKVMDGAEENVHKVIKRIAKEILIEKNKI